MGVSLKTLIRLQTLHWEGFLPDRGSIVEIGAQNLVCRGFEAVVEQFIRYFRTAAGLDGLGCTSEDVDRLAQGGTMAELMGLCGFTYEALDIFDAPGCRLFDLNLNDPDPDLVGRFDLVTNFGTTEHVVNQYKAMATMHQLAKVGGLIYHDLPMGGYFDHGYFNYTPLFFQHLALANEYTVVGEFYVHDPAARPVPGHMRLNGYEESFYQDAGIEFVLRKTSMRPFVLPLETGTSLGLNADLWGGEPPYRVISGASEQIKQAYTEASYHRLDALRRQVRALGAANIAREARQWCIDKIRRRLAPIYRSVVPRRS